MNSIAPFRAEGPAVAPISPMLEMGAYEAMWLKPGRLVQDDR